MSRTVPSLRPQPSTATLFAGVMGAALFPATPALAAADTDAAAGRSDIVVIGRQQADANPDADPQAPYKIDRSSNGKFTEEVRDTPKSITIIPKEVIEDVGATTFREIDFDLTKRTIDLKTYREQLRIQPKANGGRQPVDDAPSDSSSDNETEPER